MSQTFKGVGVSPGIGVGRAYLLHAASLPAVPTPVPPERVDQEIERFQAARVEARRELESLKSQVGETLGGAYAGIFEAQLLILDDPSLVAETELRIRVGRVAARWALKETVAQFSRRFADVQDPYLRERGGDLADVHHRLQRLLRGGTRRAEPREDSGPWIVVAHSVMPSDAVTLAGKGVVGLATDEGGRTSHTAILAQALSVPAVAGLHDLSEGIGDHDSMIVDGSRGVVHVLPSVDQAERAAARHRAWVALEERAMAEAGGGPVVTRDGVEVSLRANIEFPHEVGVAQRFGAQGIGLYRSEFLFLTCSPAIPTEEEHHRTYSEIAARVAPHPAVIRTLDLGGEKYFHEVLGPSEPNPVLGRRAVRLCLERPDIFRPQLRGLLRAAVADNLQLMLPLVTTVAEVREVRRLLALEADQLQSEGVAVRREVPLGVMIEVPGAAMAADLLAREANFLSIGSNDLIQYALAVDRNNEAVNYLYQPLHPGVLRLVRCIVDAGRAQAIPVSICGEMGTDPEIVGLLVGLGLREISIQPRAIAAVREALAALDSREAVRQVQELMDGVGSSPDDARHEAPSMPGG